MTDLWVWLSVMVGFALLFVLWPLLGLRGKNEAVASGKNTQRESTNDNLYQEQLTEIEKDFDNGRIDESAKQKRIADLQRIHESDLSQESGSNAPQTQSASSSRAVTIWAVVAVAVILPLLSGFIYFSNGSVSDFEISLLDSELSQYVKANEFDENADAMLDKLREKLEQAVSNKPDNMRNWYLLANVAYDQKDVQRSIEAYSKILEQNPNSPGVMSNLVQVLYVASGNKFTDDTRKLFSRALSLDANNHGLLILGGLDAFEQEHFSNAVTYWSRALALTREDDPRRTQLQDFVSQARMRLMLAGEAGTASEDTQEEPTPASETAITLSVSLAEHVDADPGDRVFVYARAWQGPPMPLSIADLTVADLPTTIRLDSSKSMIPGMTLDRFPQIELIARISSTGNNTAKSGEWEATQGPVSLSGSDNTAELVITERRP